MNNLRMLRTRRPGVPSPELTLVDDPSDVRRAHRAPAPDAVRVVIGHGESLARAGLRALLEDSADVSVVEVAADGEGLVSAARELRPDVVVMDIGLPGSDALEIMRQVAGEPTDDEDGRVGLVVLIGDEPDEVIFAAIRAGARGIVSAEATAKEFVRTVGTVADGNTVLAPNVARCVIEAALSRPEHLDVRPDQLDDLTEREREIMALVGWGLSNAEIAERLVISPATVKTHATRAMLKLHVHDRTRLAVLAYQTGLVRTGDSGDALAPGTVVAHPVRAVA